MAGSPSHPSPRSKNNASVGGLGNETSRLSSTSFGVSYGNKDTSHHRLGSSPCAASELIAQIQALQNNPDVLSRRSSAQSSLGPNYQSKAEGSSSMLSSPVEVSGSFDFVTRSASSRSHVRSSHSLTIDSRNLNTLRKSDEGGVSAREKKRPSLLLSQLGGGNQDSRLGGRRGDAISGGGALNESMVQRYADYFDAATGTLKFAGKAVLNSDGVEFEGGRSFKISLDEVDVLEELGKGNYGTVFKVRHSRPRGYTRQRGLGLAGIRRPSIRGCYVEDGNVSTPTNSTGGDANEENISPTSQNPTSGVILAMKEIRLELDEAKLTAIMMELDILHRCISPKIVGFYGAFFQEGAVYICMEFMDGGSIDKLCEAGVPEAILRKITHSTVCGLKYLKDQHSIIHRDIKPTNILMNTRGEIKICDFGVSGNLVASFAKTNVGCQSYMAPERICGSSGAVGLESPEGGVTTTYSVQSDIWSLGITIIECATGKYPYPADKYENIFSLLSEIVDGDPPRLPDQGYSQDAQKFVSACLNKDPAQRPSFPDLLQHAWIADLTRIEESLGELGPSSSSVSHCSMMYQNDENAPVCDAEVAEWVQQALKRRLGKLLGDGSASVGCTER